MNDLTKRRRLKELSELYKYDIALTDKDMPWKEESPEDQFLVLSVFHCQAKIAEAINEFLRDNDSSYASLSLLSSTMGRMLANIAEIGENTYNEKAAEKLIDKFFEGVGSKKEEL